MLVGTIVALNVTATEAARELYNWTGQQVFEDAEGRIGASWAPDATAKPQYFSNYNTIIITAEVETAPARMVNKAVNRGIEDLRTG